MNLADGRTRLNQSTVATGRDVGIGAILERKNKIRQRLAAFLTPLSSIDDRIESALWDIATTVTQSHNLQLPQDAKGEDDLREAMFTVLIDRLSEYREVHTIRGQFDKFWDTLMKCCQKGVMPYEMADNLQQSGKGTGDPYSAIMHLIGERIELFLSPRAVIEAGGLLPIHLRDITDEHYALFTLLDTVCVGIRNILGRSQIREPVTQYKEIQ